MKIITETLSLDELKEVLKISSENKEKRDYNKKKDKIKGAPK
ncbi:MAG: hypothetical protein NTZ48_05350 [Candidatus Omnitrophica bacterium]|nr:hypothetical protein [Candidatus Omnitrophota bacterium]